MPRGAGIPRLQEIDFLEVAAREVSTGATFDEVRRALIGHMASRRPDDAGAAFRLAQPNPTRYVHNTTEALTELMRLDMIDRAQLPSTKTAAAAYQTRKFAMTDKGRAWVEQVERDSREGYDHLLVELWRIHPQLAAYLELLSGGMFLVPTANWREVHANSVGTEGRPAYVTFLAQRASRAVEAGVTSWQASKDEIHAAIEEYLAARIAAAEKRRRPHPYPRNRDFIGACEEALVSFAFSQAGTKIDYISHEILRRWTRSLGVANFSYHVPDAPALRLWATADLRVTDGTPRFARRGVSAWGDQVIDELPASYERVRSRGQSSFVPIYQVRASVCSRLGLADAVFDVALREFLANERRPQASFRINLDRAMTGSVPPTEQPLRVDDRSGRTQTYTVMTLITRTERNST